MIITTEKTKQEIITFITKKLTEHLEVTNKILSKQNQYIDGINHKTLTKEELAQLSNYIQKATSKINFKALNGNYNEKDFLIIILQNYANYIYNKKSEITSDINTLKSFLTYIQKSPTTGIHPLIVGKIYINNETNEIAMYSYDNQRICYFNSNNFFLSENEQETFYFIETIHLGSLFSKHTNGQEKLLETFFIEKKGNKHKVNAFMYNGLDYNINKTDKNMMGKAKISKSFSEYLAESNLSFLEEVIYTKQTFATTLIACQNYNKLTKEVLEKIENTTVAAAAWWTELILKTTKEHLPKNSSYNIIEELFNSQDALQKLFENEIRKGLYINPFLFSMTTKKTPDIHIQNIINRIGINIFIPENITMQMSTNEIKVKMKNLPIWENTEIDSKNKKLIVKNNDSNN